MSARVAGIVAELGDADFERLAPPADLWDRIAAGVDAAAPSDEDAAASPLGAGDPEPTPVVPLERRRRRMNRSVVVAVAASVALFVAMGVLFTRGDSSPDPQLVATASLEPVEAVGPADGGATADARLVRDGDVRRLVLTARDMAAAPAGHHYELWLLDPADGEPVSLGAMSGSVTVPVPAGVDIGAYDVVDVSLQADGQVEHSGESLLRGTLA